MQENNFKELKDMTGREKCKLLKVLREIIARENNIHFNASGCNYVGECMGFCEKCDSEIRYLEKELQKKILAGEKIQLSNLAYPSLLDELSETNNEDDESYIYEGDLF